MIYKSYWRSVIRLPLSPHGGSGYKPHEAAKGVIATASYGIILPRFETERLKRRGDRMSDWPILEIDGARINRLNDRFFKYLFGRLEHRHLLLDFINDALFPEAEARFSSVEFINSELVQGGERIKLSRLDLFSEAGGRQHGGHRGAGRQPARLQETHPPLLGDATCGQTSEGTRLRHDHADDLHLSARVRPVEGGDGVPQRIRDMQQGERPGAVRGHDDSVSGVAEVPGEEEKSEDGPGALAFVSGQ